MNSPPATLINNNNMSLGQHHPKNGGSTNEELFGILRKYGDKGKNTIKRRNDKQHRYITYYPEPVNWDIPSKNMLNFMIDYCGLVEKQKHVNHGKFDICLAELENDICYNVYATFTFKSIYNELKPVEPIDDDICYWLIHSFQDAIKKSFVSETDASSDIEMIAILLKSSKSWICEEHGNKIECTSVKIFFPFAIINASQQRKYIRNVVIQTLNNNDILSLLKTKYPTLYSNNWNIIMTYEVLNIRPMYGSNEIYNIPILDFYGIYTYIDINHLGWGADNSIIRKISLKGCFSPENHLIFRHDHRNLISEHPLEYWLPLFFSGYYWLEKMIKITDTAITGNDNNDHEVPFNDLVEINNTQHEINESRYLSNGPIKIIADLMIDMINPIRFSNKNEWKNIGIAIYNIYSGNKDGCEVWLEATQNKCTTLSDIHKEYGTLQETCSFLYKNGFSKNTDNFMHNTLTVKTLAWYAKNDSIEKYSEWHKEWCKESIELSLTGLATDVALVIYRICWLDFLYTTSKNNSNGQWYVFENNKWDNDRTLSIRHFISKNVYDIYQNYRYDILTKNLNITDENTHTRNEAKSKQISSIMCKLKTPAYKSSLMSELCELFNFRNYENIFDADYMLTGTSNGVFEIDDDILIFRLCKPEDYITKSMGIDYKEYSWDDQEVQNVMQWMNQMFPDEELRDWELKRSSSGFYGRNQEKFLTVFTGSGNNSKSMYIKLITKTFGNYVAMCPHTLLLDNKNVSNGPSPEIARLAGKRFAFLSENDDEAPLNKSHIKRYTGGDSIYARSLQENGGDIKATFKLVCQMNGIPEILSPDDAVRNRLKIIPFLSQWVDDMPIDSQCSNRIFKKDPKFEQKIQHMASAYLWILKEYYHRYAVETLSKIPEIVKIHTDEYWRKKDIISYFCNEKLVKNVGGYEKISDVFREFKEWSKNSNENSKIKLSAFKEKIIKIYGNNAILGTKIIDIMIINDEDDNLNTNKDQHASPQVIQWLKNKSNEINENSSKILGDFKNESAIKIEQFSNNSIQQNHSIQYNDISKMESVSVSNSPHQYSYASNIQQHCVSSKFRSSTQSNEVSNLRPSISNCSSSGSRPSNRSSSDPRPSISNGSSSVPRPSISNGSSSASRPSISNGSSSLPRPSISNSSSSASRPSISNGSSSTSRPSISNGSSSTSRPSISNGSSSASRPSISNGSSSASRPSIPNGSSASRPSISNGSSSSSRPSISNGSSSTSRPSISNGSSSASRPSISNGSSSASKPSISNGSSSASKPSISNGSSSASRQSISNDSSSVSKPSISNDSF